MPPRPVLDALAALLVAGLIFAAGWSVKGWKDDAGRLADERQAHAETLAEVAWFDATARRTLTELQAAKESQATNRREIIRETIRYRDRTCLDAGAVGLLNDAAKGNPGGPAGEVPAIPVDAP